MTALSAKLERRHTAATLWAGALAFAFAGIGLVTKPIGVAVAPTFDWSGWGLQVVTALLPLFAIVATYYARVLADNRIPKYILPILGVVFPVIADQLAAWVSTHTPGALLAALLGAAGSLLYVIAKEFVGATGPDA